MASSSREVALFENGDKQKEHKTVRKPRRSGSTSNGSSSVRKRRYKQKQRERFKLDKMDRQIVVALMLLFVIYMLVTVGTFWNLPSLSDSRHVFFLRHPRTMTEADLLKQNRKTAAAAAGNANHMSDVAEAADTESASNNQAAAIRRLQHTFPVHVDKDMEAIPHPGVQFSRTAKGKFPSTMQVPKFWDPPPYNGVRQYLGDMGSRRMTPNEAASIGSFSQDGLPTIFASIASYRDPECVPTVESIYKRAKHPERLRVAVIDQLRQGDSKCSTPEKPCKEDPEQALCKYRHLMDFFEVDAQLSVGPVFARHLGNRMYRGEYYAMQVDSHVRFTQDWDDSIIEQWVQAKNEYGVLSVYLSDLVGSIDPVKHTNIRKTRPIMCKTDYEGAGKTRHLRHGQQPEGPPGIHGEPTLHPFWAAGFSFARGHFVVQVPYDQYLPLVFQGEEISLGLRGFTYGYDYYTPENPVCFHMYANKENKEKRNKVPLFWENVSSYKGALEQAMKRLNGIINMGQPGDSYYEKDSEKYGLGKVRTPQQFFKAFGIHPDTQTVEDHLCRWVGKPMMWEFKPHLSKDGMGINYDEITFEWKDPDPPKTKVAAKKKVAANNNLKEKRKREMLNRRAKELQNIRAKGGAANKVIKGRR